ncbi:hypothetical protein [Microterricola pindariensis]|uniref:DUF308 domain-containing protein n=1 Tax=Microterricola pindariensis TaxID=478010 RepID=A0ABX5ATT3_9MICO|nr:hypothetical protein [Microterricola pindariensis]PPL17191.1 hypothetical protein GY24_11695 [Microterricola pindariensis]
MTQTRVAAAHTSTEWIVPLSRAILLAIPAIAITFSEDHGPRFGLIVFGIWAVAAGLILGALSLRLLTDPLSRRLFATNGVLTVAAGLVALGLLGSLDAQGGLGSFLFIVTVWAACTGVLEFYAGWRTRTTLAASRDWRTAGGLTVILALVLMVLPPHSVVSVGLLGAYFAILTVFLGIAAFSLKWDSAPKRASAQPAASAPPASSLPTPTSESDVP